MADKNLFLHDLAVVAILKNEGHYLKEWLDYHLLAGVDHFYLYDNDSPDNQAEEVAKPYIEAGLVDYFSLPGKVMQYVAYNDAVKRFKFHCRYMAFIDLDEFIFPKTNQSITEVIDEILSADSSAAALGINWQTFGSNGEKTADYSRGVLERFTRRAPNDWFADDGKDLILGNVYIKSVVNPRRVDYFYSPHFAARFEGFKSINSNGTKTNGAGNRPVVADKIVVNHYHCKSWEEYKIKRVRGIADQLNFGSHPYDKNFFDIQDRNEVFDDGILKYRAARADSFTLESDAKKFRRVTAVLNKVLSEYADDKISDLEMALICRAASNYLGLKIYEEASLAAILKSIDRITSAEFKLFIRDLPNLLRLPYPFVKEIRFIATQIISQAMYNEKMKAHWRYFVELDYLNELLKSGVV